ncbi:DeoR/GlpR family DNA-binding transcription regulator [Enterococcus alishanensis]|uniref:DeoR/GlpR family DNA-binding transcription regulator n=1 Tax=Enterococcus alishanensis TaxID=1303817 RepID=A0ABS6TA20_9ENTE|nr:DeoR/GlpR family DNA-binding transcription regulator [Enterococcus alishanensis]MBV7389748.1 DeoR/GlpR family DNA-binding transcription regulator [Enterococcus alishanensis]
MNTDRQELILAVLRKKKKMTILALARAVNYSESTVRRDIRYMEKINLVKQEKGSVSFIKDKLKESPFEFKVRTNKDRKRQIGKIAVDFIEDYNTIFLDASTTALYLAKHLGTFENLRIFTTNLETASLLEKRTKNDVYMLGGYVKNGVTNGLETFKQLSGINFDVAFISSGAISADQGLSENEETEALLKQRIRENTNELIGIIDSSKFNKFYTFNSLQLSNLDYLISDEKPDTHFTEVLEKIQLDLFY